MSRIECNSCERRRRVIEHRSKPCRTTLASLRCYVCEPPERLCRPGDPVFHPAPGKPLAHMSMVYYTTTRTCGVCDPKVRDAVRW